MWVTKACIMLALLGLVWLLFFSGWGGLDVHRVAQGAAKPAVVLLHGYGAPGDDLVGLANKAVEAVPGIQVVVPEAPHAVGLGYAWWTSDRQDAIDSREAVMALIDELIEEGTPPDRIIVAGFSQGAILALDVGLHCRHDLAGVGVLSGRKQTGLGWEQRFAGRNPLRVFVSHGTKDRRVRFRQAQALVEELRTHGHKVDFVPFDGGHEIPDAASKAFFGFVAGQLGLQRSD